MHIAKQIHSQCKTKKNTQVHAIRSLTKAKQNKKMKRKEKKKEKKEHSNPLNFSATLPFVAGEDGFIFLWGLIISV